MRNIYIKYDPYEMITEFKVNNIPIAKMDHRHPWLDKVLRANSMIPLQAWIDSVPSENWGGLLSYLRSMNDDDFIVSFCGRKTDFEDLKESLRSQNQKQGNVCNIMYPADKQQFIMTDSEMKAAIDEVVHIMSQGRFGAMVEASENKELKNKYDSMKKNVSAIDSKEFRVVFTGISNSGKSTVINALVGKNILPRADGTCTDKICYIKHFRNSEYSKVVYIMTDGRRRKFLCKNGEQTQERIRKASDVTGLEKVDVYVDMSHLFPENLEDPFRLVFVDTPGTGSEEGNDVSKKSEGTRHIELTKRILSSDDKEMVVLVSDKKPDSSGIPEILDIFESKAGEDHGCYNDRFLFVLNQCDAYDFQTKQKDAMTGRYEGLENEVLKLKETVSKKSHGKEKRNIDNPRIFPISAATALAIKIGCNDARNKPERETELRAYYNAYNDFCEKLTDHSAEYYVNGTIDVMKVSSNYLLDKHCDLSELQKEELQEKYDHPNQINEYLLLHSGILSLETAIKSYIEKYAFPIKMRKLLRAFKSILEEVNEENRSYLEDLEDAREGLDDTKKKINIEKESKDRDSKRKKELETARKDMERILAKVEAIDIALPEMDDIKSRYLRMQEEANDFFEKGPDGTLVKNITNEKAEEIKAKIISKVKNLADQAKDLVEQVKTRKWETAEEYAVEFNKYLNILKDKGLLNAGSFNIENTVAYKDIVGDGSFVKYDSYARNIDNPDKEHIETDDGILNFFASIGRTIGTLFEPSQVNRVDAIKYQANLFTSLDGNVTRLIKDVKTSYESDIKRMKTCMSVKMNAVLDLITEIDEEIKKRNQKIKNDIETKESYTKKKNALEADCEFLTALTYKLKVLKQGGN